MRRLLTFHLAWKIFVIEIICRFLKGLNLNQIKPGILESVVSSVLTLLVSVPVKCTQVIFQFYFEWTLLIFTCRVRVAEAGPLGSGSTSSCNRGIVTQTKFVSFFFKLSLFTLAAGGDNDRPDGALCRIRACGSWICIANLLIVFLCLLLFKIEFLVLQLPWMNVSGSKTLSRFFLLNT